MSPRAVITGGSRGIGLAAAEQLGLLGYELELVSSRQASLEVASEALRAKGIEVANTHAVDFADLTQVKDFAAHRASQGMPWDILINNAGIKIQADARPSAQGFERHMAVNHLAHFALTSQLLHAASASARIVTVSSIVARVAGAAIFDAQGASAAYAASKLANLAFAIELQSRLEASGSGVISTAAHPGFTKADPYGTWVTRLGETLFAQSCYAGAAPLVDAAMKFDRFAYRGPRILELWGQPSTAAIPPLANDIAFRQYLWNRSNAMTGLDFDL